jgi:hypothetical protein
MTMVAAPGPIDGCCGTAGHRQGRGPLQFDRRRTASRLPRTGGRSEMPSRSSSRLSSSRSPRRTSAERGQPSPCRTSLRRRMRSCSATPAALTLWPTLSRRGASPGSRSRDRRTRRAHDAFRRAPQVSSAIAYSSPGGRPTRTRRRREYRLGAPRSRGTGARIASEGRRGGAVIAPVTVAGCRMGGGRSVRRGVGIPTASPPFDEGFAALTRRLAAE